MDTLDLARIALRRALVEVKELDISSTAAFDLVAGRYKPGLQRAADIERLIHIPAKAWATKDEPAREMWRLLTMRAD